MEQPQPLVSVIIPAYNAVQWLPDAVNSILAQAYGKWELIIVNDGSTDGTADLAKSFVNPRITVVDQANQGVSAARNTGIKRSSGELICFLDADDAMAPHNLAVKVQAIEEHGVDWAYADIALCDEQLRPTGEVLEGTPADVLRTLLLQEHPAVPLSCGNILARKSCFEQGVRFDESLSNAADQDFTMQLASRFSHAHVPKTCTLYRNLPGSMSKNVARFQEDHLRMMRNAHQRGLLEPPAFRKRCMANVYWAIGGSWWREAGQPTKGIPWLIRALRQDPSVLSRAYRRRKNKGGSAAAGAPWG